MLPACRRRPGCVLGHVSRLGWLGSRQLVPMTQSRLGEGEARQARRRARSTSRAGRCARPPARELRSAARSSAPSASGVLRRAGRQARTPLARAAARDRVGAARLRGSATRGRGRAPLQSAISTGARARRPARSARLSPAPDAARRPAPAAAWSRSRADVPGHPLEGVGDALGAVAGRPVERGADAVEARRVIARGSRAAACRRALRCRATRRRPVARSIPGNAAGSAAPAGARVVPRRPGARPSARALARPDPPQQHGEERSGSIGLATWSFMPACEALLAVARHRVGGHRDDRQVAKRGVGADRARGL